MVFANGLDLQLDFDDRRVYTAGDKIIGTVTVSPEKDVKVKSLTVATRWSTSGRGNIDVGEVDSTSVFNGTLAASQTQKYPFELAAGHWPPIYRGKILTIQHMVEARAAVSWSIDPKAVRPYQIIAKPLSEAEAKTSKLPSSFFGRALLFIFLAALIPLFLLLGLWLLVLAAIAMPFYWFFKIFLPRRMAGKVTAEVDRTTVVIGDTLTGRLAFTPPRRITVNQVSAELVLQEICVSGSGTNKTTHRERIIKGSHRLVDERTELSQGQPVELPLEFIIDPTEPPSLDLGDNKLEWSVEFRIDIPRWPDWTKTIKLAVQPGDAGVVASGSQRFAGQVDKRTPDTGDTEAIASEASDEAAISAADVGPEDSVYWLDEVAARLAASGDDPQAVQLIIDAVAEDNFDVAVDLFNRLSGSPPVAAAATADAWIMADSLQRQRKYVIGFEKGEGQPRPYSRWRGTVRLVGYDANENRIIAREVRR